MHLVLLLLLTVVQETSTPDETTIYGTSPLKGEQLFDAQYSAERVDNDDLTRRRMSRTLPEALEELPGVSVQKTGPGQGSPFIRGFTGFRNVLQIDEVRLNNSVFREGPNQYWATVDSYLIDRMELIRGPSSVLYGSDSMGGTLLAWTTEPALDGSGFHGRSIFRYASHEESFQARQEFSMSGDAVGAMIGGTFRDYGDLRAADLGRLEETGYDQYGADAKLVFGVGAKSKIVVAYQHDRTQDANRWHRTVNNDHRWQGTAAGTERSDLIDQERDLAYLQYHGKYEGAFVDAVTVGVSYHRQAEDENRNQNPATAQAQFRDFDVDTVGGFARAGKDTTWGYVTAGLEVYLDWVASSGVNRNAAGVSTVLPRGNVAAEADYLLWGIYLQDEIDFGAVHVTPGIRFSRASVDADGVDPVMGGSPLIPDSLEDDYQAVTGSLRVVIRATDEWNVIAGWGMGFRAPSLDDTTGSASVAGGSTDFGGPDLDPEKSHTFDLGVRADHKVWGVTAFGFYTLLRDFINRVNIGDVNGDTFADFARVNAGEGWVYGFEAALFYRPWEELTLFFDWGYARGKVDQVSGTGADLGEQPLGKVGPSMIHLGARWEPKGKGTWAELLWTAADEQTHLSVTDVTDTQRIPPGGTPGYGMLTLRGGFTVAETLRISVAVENVFDKDYRIHGSGQNEPGLGVVFGADARF
jgi:hemoglobin/transferrin/lactoferrin receptor protein